MNDEKLPKTMPKIKAKIMSNRKVKNIEDNDKNKLFKAVIFFYRCLCFVENNKFISKYFLVEKKRAIIITGATGSGKSDYAIQLAKQENGVIINIDCMQIYKQIPVLSAQPTEFEKAQVPHFLYGFFDIKNYYKNPYSVGQYLQDLQKILHKIEVKMPDKLVILVGGTMMYVDAVLNGLSEVPENDENVRQAVRNKFQNMPVEDAFAELLKIDEKYAKMVDKSNKQRILRALEVVLSTGKSILDFWEKDDDKGAIFKDFEVKKYVKQIERDELYKRIDARFDKMIQFGALEEARALYEFGKNHNLPKAIGLYELFNYFDGKISLDVAINEAKKNSRHYAKRQLTWIRNRFNDFEIL